MSDGRFVVPTIETPPCSTTSPGTVSSQLPPVSAATSTITEPERIRSTALAGMSFGAGRPGTAAVVTTTSKSGMRSSSAACCCACSSGVSSRAYPPSVSSVRMPSSRNAAPRLSTCSFTAGRTSNEDTTAPSLRAVAIACRPATPAPMTSARTGAIVPAAVMSIGKSFGTRSAARSTAL